MSTEMGIVPDFFDIVDSRVDDEYRVAGYSKVALDGTEVPDEDKMKARALEVALDAVVKTKTEKSQKAVTQGELFARVFPLGPGAQPGTADQLDPIEAEVASRLTRKVWALTNPGPRGYLQKRLTGVGDGSLILCRASVLRKMDWVPGFYLTDTANLIMDDSMQPQVERPSSASRMTSVSMPPMIQERHPELEARLSTAIGSGISRARSAAQLSAGSTNGRKPVVSEPKSENGTE